MRSKKAYGTDRCARSICSQPDSKRETASSEKLKPRSKNEFPFRHHGQTLLLSFRRNSTPHLQLRHLLSPLESTLVFDSKLVLLLHTSRKFPTRLVYKMKTVRQPELHHSTDRIEDHGRLVKRNCSSGHGSARSQVQDAVNVIHTEACCRRKWSVSSSSSNFSKTVEKASY